MSSTDVVVIGAGPYGLSISAHLRTLGVQHVIVGRTMDTWRTRMPTGMFLKSEPYGSTFPAPRDGYDIADFHKSHGLDYVARLGPLSLERLLGYADWYAEQLVPDVLDDTVTGVTAVDGGFRVTFAQASPVVSRQVVIATGVQPYAYIPAELASLPSGLVSHTIDHHELDEFRGRKVAVVGAGQSALETAALLHEQGVDVRVVARTPALFWNKRNREHVSAIGRIRTPVNNLCEGWHCTFWNTPAAFRRLPRDMQVTKARTFLGPAGSWWLRERVDGVVEVLTGHRVRNAEPNGSGVRLTLDGAESVLDVDHVIAGTGFRIDLARLPFLPDELRSKITCLKGYPVLTRTGESAVPGLYFTGAPAAGSIGPSLRFIAGTHNISGLLAKSLARRTRTGKGPVVPEDRVPVAR
jgi:thioredoxin reductase